MSKKVTDPSQKLNREQILAVIVGGLAYTATAGVSYIIYMYYSMYQNATGFTDGQIGTIMSVISVIAIISYLFGGPLADKFRPKVLLVFCCLSTAALACLMITFPPYELMLPLQALLALCALLPHWCPLSKFLTSLGKNSEQTNKIWGYYSAVVGATTAIVGFACSAILKHFDPRTGMRITVLIYVALEILCAILLPMVDKSKHSDQLAKSNDFSFRSVLELLKMPKVWLVYLSRTCLYMLGMAMMYLDPLMRNGFGVPLATIALITTIRGSFGIFTGPIAGNVAAKLHSSLKAHLILYGIAAAGLLILLVIPYGSGTFVFALIGIAILAIASTSGTTYGTPMLVDAGIPQAYLGTAVGFCSVINTIPDTFIFPLSGKAIEAFGLTAYRGIFGVLLCVLAIGAVLNTTLIRIRNKELEAEAANR